MVMGIITIMTIIVAPNVTQNYDAGSHHRERNKLRAWAQWCQSQAILEQRYYQISFDTNNEMYTIEKYDGISWILIETVYLEPGTSFSSCSFPDDTLRFNQFGAPIDTSYIPVTTNNSISIRNKDDYVTSFVVDAVSGRTNV